MDEREVQHAKEIAVKAILESQFFISVAVTPRGTATSVVGNGSKLITALLDDDFKGDGKLLIEITQIRAILQEILTDYLDVKEMPQYKMIRALKRMKDEGIFDQIKKQDDKLHD